MVDIMELQIKEFEIEKIKNKALSKEKEQFLIKIKELENQIELHNRTEA